MQTSINKNKRHKTLLFLNTFSMKMELDTMNLLCTTNNPFSQLYHFYSLKVESVFLFLLLVSIIGRFRLFRVSLKYIYIYIYI